MTAAVRAALVAAAVALTGCGGEDRRTAATACDGVPVGKPTETVSLFGALDQMSRRWMCEKLGRPDDLVDRGQRERWTYGDVQVVYDEQLDGAVDLR